MLPKIAMSGTVPAAPASLVTLRNRFRDPTLFKGEAVGRGRQRGSRPPPLPGTLWLRARPTAAIEFKS